MINIKMTHGSLFSGIGGFDLAAEWMGWQNIFHCEWNEFGQKILKYYWPNAISYDDITKTDFTIHRGKIDILTGGFPCQPYSNAGKRKGKEDARHLWPEMLRAIREIQPAWILGENVGGIISWNGGLVFEEVQAELESEGYQVQSFILPSAGVGAPHKRDRVWFIANNTNARIKGERATRQNSVYGFRNVTYSNGQRNTSPKKSGEIETRRENILTAKRQGRCRSKRIDRLFRFQRYATYPNGKRLEGATGKRNKTGEGGENRIQFGEFTRSSPGYWESFPTQAPICNGDDGLSSRLDSITFPKWRTESIKGGGNAIVPQVAHQIFKVIQEMSK